MIMPKAKKHGGETSAAVSGASSQKKPIPPIDADDAEIQAFIDNPDDYKIPEDVDPDYDVGLKELREELDLIAAGDHPDYPSAPRREDFSSKLDYLKADLEFDKANLARAKGTEYQEAFESIVDTSAKLIELEKRRIERDEYNRKRTPEMENSLIDINVSSALIAAQLSEEDFDEYLEIAFQSIPSHLKDAVVEKFFRESEVLETSESPPFSDVPSPLIDSRDASIDSREVSEVPIPTDQTDTVNERMLPDQIDSWEKALRKEYPDIFAYPDAEKREALSQKFPSEGARQLFRDRQTALHKEYVVLLESQLKGVPKEKRDQAISTFRESLSQKWDRDFADAVIDQFHRPRDE